MVTKTSCRQPGQLVHKQDKFLYVPILETLEILPQNEFLSSQVIAMFSQHHLANGIYAQAVVLCWATSNFLWWVAL